ncbi:MAG: PfkB family carbohydrate kinase [Thermoleophilia bacterium]
MDVLKLAADEAAALGVASEAAGLASLGVGEVVLTLGSRGALVVADGRAARVEIEPLEVADTTGAGDAFAAAYLALRQAGAEPVEAGRAAAAVVGRLLA